MRDAGWVRSFAVRCATGAMCGNEQEIMKHQLGDPDMCSICIEKARTGVSDPQIQAATSLDCLQALRCTRPCRGAF